MARVAVCAFCASRLSSSTRRPVFGTCLGSSAVDARSRTRERSSAWFLRGGGPDRPKLWGRLELPRGGPAHGLGTPEGKQGSGARGRRPCCRHALGRRRPQREGEGGAPVNDDRPPGVGSFFRLAPEEGRVHLLDSHSGRRLPVPRRWRSRVAQPQELRARSEEPLWAEGGHLPTGRHPDFGCAIQTFHRSPAAVLEPHSRRTRAGPPRGTQPGAQERTPACLLRGPPYGVPGRSSKSLPHRPDEESQHDRARPGTGSPDVRRRDRNAAVPLRAGTRRRAQGPRRRAGRSRGPACRRRGMENRLRWRGGRAGAHRAAGRGGRGASR